MHACITNKSQIRDLHQSNLILFFFFFCGRNLAHRNVHTWCKHVWGRVIDNTYAQHSHPCNHSQDALLHVKQTCSLHDFWMQVYWMNVRPAVLVWWPQDHSMTADIIGRMKSQSIEQSKMVSCLIWHLSHVLVTRLAWHLWGNIYIASISCRPCIPSYPHFVWLWKALCHIVFWIWFILLNTRYCLTPLLDQYSLPGLICTSSIAFHIRDQGKYSLKTGERKM